VKNSSEEIQQHKEQIYKLNSFVIKQQEEVYRLQQSLSAKEREQQLTTKIILPKWFPKGIGQFLERRFSSINAYSERDYGTIPEYFDWRFYLDTYPDLKHSGIDTAQKSWVHWNESGILESRVCNKEMM
jgi:hypothetical protein